MQGADAMEHDLEMEDQPKSIGFEQDLDFSKVVVNAQMLSAARSVMDWHTDAPNPLIVLAPNGAGKTTFLQMLAKRAGDARPDKVIYWLSDRPSANAIDLRSRVASEGEMVLAALDTLEAQSADLLLIDDAFGMLDDPARSRFLDGVEQRVSDGIQVVIATSRSDWLRRPGEPDQEVIFPRGVVVRLEPFRSHIDHGPAQEYETAAVELRALPIERLPNQADIAPRFETGGSGPIRVRPEPRPTVTDDKQEIYEELCIKARQFLDAVPREDNRTARVRNLVVALLEQLPDDLGDVRPLRLWSKGNSLRRSRDADLRIQRSPDPDGIPLAEHFAEMLSDLVEQYNVFAIYDEELSKIDADSLGPRDRAHVLAELEAGRLVSLALSSTPGVADPSAVAVLDEAVAQGDEATSQTGINADHAISQSLATHRNGAIAVLAKAVNEVKSRLKSAEDGAWKYVGEEAAKLVFANFVKLYEKPLGTLFAGVQGGDVASYVLRLLHKLLSG